MGGTLTVTGLSAGYRNRPVLRSLSLAPLEPGRVTALVDQIRIDLQNAGTGSLSDDLADLYDD